MGEHDDCQDSEFCLSPLHPGPCKGSGKGGGGGGGGGKKKAVKAKKAPVAKKGTAAQQKDAKSAGAAATLAGLADGVDGRMFGDSLARGLAGARTDADRNAVITEHALQLGRVLANTHAPKASPLARKQLARHLALAVNDGIRSGDARQVQELVGKFGGGLDDDDIKILVAGRRSTTAAATTDGPPKKKIKTWSGVLAPIGKATGDGRMFAPSALTNRDFPLPLSFQRQDNGGHSGKVVVARILGIEYRDGEVYGYGDWLDPDITPEVVEAQELSRQGVIGPSVDLDNTTMQLVPVEGEEASADCGCDGEELAAEDALMIKLITAGRISGATLVQIPAFAECAALTMGEDGDDAGTVGFAPGDPVTLAVEGDTAYYVGDDGITATVIRDDGQTHEVALSDLLAPVDDEDAQAWEDALMASAGDGLGVLLAAAVDGPPAAWFDDPQFDGPTALTVTADGRVFGHLATWNTCHVGLPGCVTAPSSASGYAYFHTGAVVTREGREVGVGRITLGTGHADADAGFQAAAEHYDNTGTCAATVRAGDDAYGIWVAGATTPECDELKTAELRRSPLSGDWRRVGAHLELVAALAVNSGGFPVPRSMVADGRPMSLVAAGMIDPGTTTTKTADIDIDAAVDRVLSRRAARMAAYDRADGVFAAVEADRARERVEVAAAYLAVLE